MHIDELRPPGAGRLDPAPAWRWFGWETLIILLLPPAAWYLLGIVLINQDGFVDPWIYTGYGQHFELLHTLFGWLYYSVRFPVIVLNEAAWQLGAVTGYVVLRYLLLLACGTALYAWTRRTFGRSVAMAGYLFLIVNPLLPRVLLWDLTPFVSVPMALAGMSVWLVADDRPGLRLLSGGLLCAAICAHAFTGSAVGMFLLVQASRRVRSGEWRALFRVDVLCTAGGAAICIALGCLYLFVRVGAFDPTVIVRTTVDMVSVGNLYAETHRTPYGEWAAREWYVYVPALCLFLSAALLGGRVLRNTAVASVWWFGAAYTAFYLIDQFVLGRFVLETFYYFAHLTLVVYMLVPVILSEMIRRLSSSAARRVVAAACVALVAVPLLNHLVPDRVDVWMSWADRNVSLLTGLTVVAGLLIAFAPWLRRQAATAAVAAAGFALLVQAFTFLNLPHRMVFDSRRWDREVGVYRTNVQMLDLFATYSRPAARVMLWFCPRQTSLLSLASSTLLFTVNDPFAADPDGCDGMLGEYELTRLVRNPVQFVLMLDEGGGSFPARERALNDAGFSTATVQARTLRSGSYSTEARLLRVEIAR